MTIVYDTHYISSCGQMYHSNYGQVIKDAVFSHNLDEPPKNCSLFVVVEMVLVMAQPCKKLLCSNYGRKTICLRLKEEPSKNTAWKFGRWDGFSVFLSFFSIFYTKELRFSTNTYNVCFCLVFLNNTLYSSMKIWRKIFWELAFLALK